jgi:uncharacterized protein YbjT (DUF2867 family)
VAAGHGPHVVKIAADGFADPGCDVRFMLSHRQVAAHLDATGLPATYLAPALYMEDLLAAADTISGSGEVSVPAGHGRVGFVAASDVAAVAARVLTSPDHAGATYVVTGPEALRFKDVAARISAVFAREVDYTDQSPERARELMLAGGVSPWRADGNLELFDWIRQGGADNVTATVREVTGADPQLVQDWLEESRADFEVPLLDLPRSVF